MGNDDKKNKADMNGGFIVSSSGTGSTSTGTTTIDFSNQRGSVNRSATIHENVFSPINAGKITSSFRGEATISFDNAYRIKTSDSYGFAIKGGDSFSVNSISGVNSSNLNKSEQLYIKNSSVNAREIDSPTKIRGANSLGDIAGTTSDNDFLNITQKYAEGFYWQDMNDRLVKLSDGLSESNKNILDAKKDVGKVMIALSKQNKKVESFDTSLSIAEKKLESKVKEFESEVVTARNSLLGVIALFASFFTFISISVNIFSRDMSLSTSISVLLIIWSCLISFIFLFMAGISKGGAFFTSSSFLKHTILMVVLFFCSFGLPRVFFSIFHIN